MFSRENLDWMSEAPKMSYNETLGRPVFLNREAFYICLSGLADPSVFKQVEFEIDEHFEKHYKKQTGDEKSISPTPFKQTFLNKSHPGLRFPGNSRFARRDF